MENRGNTIKSLSADDFFRLGVCERGIFFRERYVKGVPFRERYVKGAFFKGKVCERGTFSGKGIRKGANFRNLVCESVPIFQKFTM